MFSTTISDQVELGAENLSFFFNPTPQQARSLRSWIPKDRQDTSAKLSSNSPEIVPFKAAYAYPGKWWLGEPDPRATTCVGILLDIKKDQQPFTDICIKTTRDLTAEVGYSTIFSTVLNFRR